MPNRLSGRFHNTKGAIKETIGRTIGWHGLEMRGASERQRGQAEFRAAQAKGVVNATGNRVKGKGNQIAGAVTGDRTREMRGAAQNDHANLMQTVHRNV